MANLQVKNDIVAIAQITVISAMVEKLTGEKPLVYYYDNFAEIRFTESQKKVLQNYIESQLRQKGDSRIRVDLLPVFVPAVSRVYGKYILGAVALAFWAGKLLSKAKQ